VLSSECLRARPSGLRRSFAREEGATGVEKRGAVLTVFGVTAVGVVGVVELLASGVCGLCGVCVGECVCGCSGSVLGDAVALGECEDGEGDV
jgi:hypothetical protein